MMQEGAIVVISESSGENSSALSFAQKLGENIQRSVAQIVIGNSHPAEGVPIVQTISEIGQFVNDNEPAMLVFDLQDNRKIQSYLSACREIRVPYCFVKAGQSIDFSEIAVPVSMLMEDKEKAPFASMFGRFCKSQITVFEPNDYGSKAHDNVLAIASLLDKFQLNYTIQKGRKNSFGIEFEVALSAREHHFGVVLISASREYGLDDVIFGCKEKKIIRKAQVPILLINPRADLYTLCD